MGPVEEVGLWLPQENAPAHGRCRRIAVQRAAVKFEFLISSK